MVSLLKQSSHGGFSDIWRLAAQNRQNVVFTVRSFRVCKQDPIDQITQVRS